MPQTARRWDGLGGTDETPELDRDWALNLTIMREVRHSIRIQIEKLSMETVADIIGVVLMLIGFVGFPARRTAEVPPIS